MPDCELNPNPNPETGSEPILNPPFMASALSQPRANPLANGANPIANGANPIANGANPIANGANPIANGANPNGANPIANGANPIANGANPIANGANPNQCSIVLGLPHSSFRPRVKLPYFRLRSLGASSLRTPSLAARAFGTFNSSKG